MDKGRKVKGKARAATSLEDEAKKAVGENGAGFVRVREDGAVCFGDDCVVISSDDQGVLQFEIDPSSCGQIPGARLVEHMRDSWGKPVTIKMPPQVK